MSKPISKAEQRQIFVMAGTGAGVFAFLLHGLLAGRPAVPLYEPPSYQDPSGAHAVAPGGHGGPAEGEKQELPQGGEGLYAVKCLACHQANGAGLPGAFPPLAGSSWLTEDPETPIRIVLLGVTGPIEVNGQSFDSTMPSLGLSDGEIADILTYARSAWGNQAEAITPETVAEVRASLEGRTAAWDAQTLSSLRTPK